MNNLGVGHAVFPSIHRFVSGLTIFLFCLLPTIACAELSELQRAHLTQVWQEEFAAPQLFNSVGSHGSVQADPYLQSTTLAPGAQRLPEAARAGYQPSVHVRSDQPHPAVARIVVPEGGATSYGSGTLVDVRDDFGLVITNWHVVRDATGPVEVHFPGGFKSKARALKVDADWDLAALVIWKPPVLPVEMSAIAPRPGDQLTICGYGAGTYRAATGRCTQYYAPRTDFPQEMVELNVEARQGDSGGPIFNQQGQLAGVLFGAGQGTTLGSFGGRVETFLATLAPDIGREAEDGLVAKSPTSESMSKEKPGPQVICRDGVCYPVESPLAELPANEPVQDAGWEAPSPQLAGMWASRDGPGQIREPPNSESATDANGWRSVPRYTWFAQVKTALAAVGLITVCMFMLKAVC